MCAGLRTRETPAGTPGRTQKPRVPAPPILRAKSQGPNTAERGGDKERADGTGA